MTAQDGAPTPWWQRTSSSLTFDEFLCLWNTTLPQKLRVVLLQEIAYAWTGSIDNAPRIRFLIGLFGDIQIDDGRGSKEYHVLTREIAGHAAEQLVATALNGSYAGSSYARDPQLFPDVLRVLLKHGSFFDDKKKQLLHKLKDGLRWLYGPAREPWHGVYLQETEDAKSVINTNLPLLIECLCIYDLFDVIEDATDSTLALLERIALQHGGSIESVAYGKREGRNREAACRFLYLRAKRAHLTQTT